MIFIGFFNHFLGAIAGGIVGFLVAVSLTVVLIHDRSLIWLGTGLSTKSGRVKLVSYP
jgi:hypothetical protein